MLPTMRLYRREEKNKNDRSPLGVPSLASL